MTTTKPYDFLNRIRTTPIIGLVFALTACNQSSVSLGQIDLQKYGFTNSKPVAIEMERTSNTSKIKITPERSGPLGESMFVAMALYEIAQARRFEYFVSLKEWNEPDGSWVYVAGFTNKKNADVKQEFGREYSYENESGRQRSYFSVAELTRLLESQRRNIMRSASTNAAPAPR